MIESYEYDLEYKNYLAKKELLNELSNISLQYNGIILEAESEAKVRQLSIESIMKYIRKIIGNIQSAWDKFKSSLEDTTWQKMKSYYSKAYNIDRPLRIDQVNENDKLPILKNVEEFIKIDNGRLNTGDLEKFSNKEELI